jgi:hypothetical protein
VTTVEVPTVESLARQALETLIERHDLPRPPRIYWREEPGEVRVAFDTDAEVDRWATTLFRSAHADFGGRDNNCTPGEWSVHRYYGFRIRRWMGIGVSLEVFHAETRNAYPKEMTS